ncbi:hypothetical protein P872_14090 [Rhodonellum psychrophilum GCM71 = DSM 17998]|uniref:Uncharacterized protein n=2 Tax=Rhodonellum TaxID=336827 RepID=U5BIH4_9BACT|nr:MULTISPECIES: hypothetical protein [Rhodonellum]ERM80215.1 hypothetical protein P872_14090 [Rhodonellum psychrophilum GCM71 = DSM 17998]SDZ35837.1 hypothetical protein SAMN05444412_11166 [Rhodonellum ikkaensis]
MNPQYEKNEYELAKSFCTYFKIKNPIIHPTLTPFAPIDIEYVHKDQQYIMEIKCRKDHQQNGYMIEKSKLQYMIPRIVEQNMKGYYINYIESSDTLLLFDLNSRKNLELEDIYGGWNNQYYYDKIYTQSSTYNYNSKLKFVKYLFLNQYQTKDYIIYNYSQLMKTNNIAFNYKKI